MHDPQSRDRIRALLEFERVRGELMESALSEEGRALIAAQPVQTERGELDALLDLVGEWKGILQRGFQLPQLSFPPVGERLHALLKEGAVGEAQDLAAIGQFALSAGLLKRYLARATAEESTAARSALAERAHATPELAELASRILAVLEPDGSVREERIPALRAIRRRMQALHGEIDELAARHLNADRSLWQSDVPTQKDGRTVLPLKASFRGRVDGIVHEVSATGATLFVEPLDIVAKSNDLIEQENRYRQELLRILRELSELVRESAAPIRAQVEAIAFLDSVHARARYAVAHRCARALSSERDLVLVQARHPQLGPRAVPIDLELKGDIRVLVITGPNTGGKTVALKTVGLLALMNQFGMEVPAAEPTSLPLFDAVYADIGDDQSIDDSLSTFSAHMRSIARALESATSRSLVLLDEVGSGTDPSEGSAIAMALLDRLRANGVLTVATTHHGVLKNYALSTPGVANASVAFDEATLTPTFRVIMGVPGESHALEIAEQSGIDRALMADARRYIEGESTTLSRAIREVAARHAELRERLERVGEAEQSIESDRRVLAAREERIRARERELRESDVTELRRYLSESRRTLENLVRELRTGEITREKTRKVKEFIDQVEQTLDRELDELENEHTAATARGEPAEAEERSPRERGRRAGAAARTRAEPVKIEPGVEVLVGSARRRGTVVRKARGNAWVVAVKTLHLTVSESELVPAPRAPQLPGSGVSAAIVEVSAGAPPAFELDVRGMRLPDALHALEQQIDRATIGGLGEFSVIHGLGEGILQQGVHDYLRTCPGVAEYHFSRPEEGGFGKTVVRLGSKRV